MLRPTIAAFVTIVLLAIIACTAPKSESALQGTIPSTLAYLATATVSPLPSPTPEPTATPAWARVVNPTGITYEIPTDWSVEDFDLSYQRPQPPGGTPPEVGNIAHLWPPVLSYISGIAYDYIQIEVSRRPTQTIAAHAQNTLLPPYALGSGLGDQRHARFVKLGNVWSVHYSVSPGGIGWTNPPIGAEPCCGSLQVWIVNPGCRTEMMLSAFFGTPGPVDALAVQPLEDVVHEHFPVLDHMIQSVTFPPPCGEDWPRLPDEWLSVTNQLGTVIPYPNGYYASEGGVSTSQTMRGQSKTFYPQSLPANVSAEWIDVSSWQPLSPGTPAPEVHAKGSDPFLVQRIALTDHFTATLKATLRNAPKPDLSQTDSIGTVQLEATIESDLCPTVVLVEGWLDLTGIPISPNMNLAEIVAVRAPVFDHIFRHIQRPIACPAS